MGIGDNIRKLRQQRGYTQSDFAKLLNVTQGAISQWEKGATCPDIMQLTSIAQMFDVSTDFLLLGQEKKQHTYSDAELKFALFDGDQSITDAQFEEVKRFAQFIRERDRRDK